MIVEETSWRDPVEAFFGFVGEPGAHLFHAGADADARWSFIVSHPLGEATARDGAVQVDGEACAANVFDLIETRARSFHWEADLDHAVSEAPFLAGAAGFVGYETGGAFEPAARGRASPFPLPDLQFNFYDGAVVFDRENRRAYRCFLNADSGARAARRLEIAAPPVEAPVSTANDFASDFTRAGYQHAVEEVIEAIRNGDIFQANIAQTLSAEINDDALYPLFRRLSAASHAPFGAFLQFVGGAVLSDSPERMFRVTLEDGVRRIAAEPIKGTRPRGDTPEEDVANALALSSSKKDRAENIMIADLIRNDLSRICFDDSIREDAICELRSYAAVHHLVSRISGVLRDVSLGDVFAAIFPCGSITGAPKIEAMRTISRIEKVGRGPYCGAIGFVDARGGSDFSVAIRTMTAIRCNDAYRLHFPVGGGVTLRSDPREEYEETLFKARSFLRALALEGERPQ